MTEWQDVYWALNGEPSPPLPEVNDMESAWKFAVEKFGDSDDLRRLLYCVFWLGKED